MKGWLSIPDQRARKRGVAAACVVLVLAAGISVLIMHVVHYAVFQRWADGWALVGMTIFAPGPPGFAIAGPVVAVILSHRFALLAEAYQLTTRRVHQQARRMAGVLFTLHAGLIWALLGLIAIVDYRRSKVFDPEFLDDLAKVAALQGVGMVGTLAATALAAHAFIRVGASPSTGPEAAFA